MADQHTTPPLPEAPASFTVGYRSTRGYDCTLTLRGHDEAVILRRLHTLMDRMAGARAERHDGGMALPAEVAGPNPAWCGVHGCAMKRHERDGQTWYSHKAPDRTWCRGHVRVTGSRSERRRSMDVPIDNCPCSFAEPANEIPPQYMERLREQMCKPIPIAEFAIKGKGPASVSREHGLGGGFSGCYMLLDSGRPVYVGISGSVLARSRQHVSGRTHHDASLAYSMAACREPHKKTRPSAMEDTAFRTVFTGAQGRLKRSEVAFFQIEDPVALHLFEVYCTMVLDTYERNSVETH